MQIALLFILVSHNYKQLIEVRRHDGRGIRFSLMLDKHMAGYAIAIREIYVLKFSDRVGSAHNPVVKEKFVLWIDADSLTFEFHGAAVHSV